MEKRNFKSKLLSMKFIFTAWATGLLTYIVIANRTEFLQVAIMLAAAPLGYCVTNVIQKKILEKELNKEEVKNEDRPANNA